MSAGSAVKISVPFFIFKGVSFESDSRNDVFIPGSLSLYIHFSRNYRYSFVFWHEFPDRIDSVLSPFLQLAWCITSGIEIHKLGKVKKISRLAFWCILSLWWHGPSELVWSQALHTWTTCFNVRTIQCRKKRVDCVKVMLGRNNSSKRSVTSSTLQHWVIHWVNCFP